MIEVNNKSKYSKIQQMVSLPQKRHLDKSKQVIFEKTPITQEESLHVNGNILRKRNQLIDQLQNQLQLFTATQYKFKFPESKFPNVPQGQRNNISYAHKVEVQEEDTFENKLSDLQIEQIKQRGEFEVKSKAYSATIPYVWKINGCILRGRLKRKLIWENGLAWCYNFIDTAYINLKKYVPQGFRDLLKLPVKFFEIIFGKKQLTVIHSPDYSRQIYKDFWANIMNDELKEIQNQVGHDFLKLLYFPYYEQVYKHVDQTVPPQERAINEANRLQRTKIYNQNISRINNFKQTIKKVESGFETHWLKIRKRVLTKVSYQLDEHLNQKLVPLENDQQPLKEQIKKKDRAVLEKLYEQKFLIYSAHIKQNFHNQKIGDNVIQTLMFLMLLFATIQRKILLKNQKLKEIQGNLRQKIDKKYPVRSKNKKFKERKFKNQYLLIKQQIQTQFFDRLLLDVINKNNFNLKYQSIYAKYVNLVKNFDKLVEQKKQKLICLYKPSRVFRTTYILFPPYQVVKTNNYYSLKTRQQMRIDTSNHFWKCSLYAMRLKSWSLNCLKFLLGVSWAGPLGFRCLFGIQNFKYDESVDYQTGVKGQITRAPFLGRFCKVLRGIKKSRAYFQGLPDRGLFGKNCSRICNYIQCYIFRLIIVGVICVLMLYPVGIILFSFICLVGVLTAWIWVPLAMVLCYLFNILIFQFQVSSYPEGCLIRSVPLVSLLVQIFFALFKIIGPIIFLIIIAPLICLGYFLYLIVQRIARTIADTIMVCLIGCFGRTPSRDTAIAKKISGPGLSRNYFFSIAEQDVYILTQAALQKIIANKYIQIIRKKIKQSTDKYSTLTRVILKPFGLAQPNLHNKIDIINSNNNQLMQNFNKQVNFYLARYPNNPVGVRFTQEQIQLYFENSVKIVKNFVKREQAQAWIFEERGLLNEDYQQLTRLIWTQIFNCGDQIFQPLQKIDNRFKLIDQQDDANNSNQMQKNVNSIMQALQGQIELDERKPNFTPFKRSLLQRDYPINYINQICQLHRNNSQNRLNLDIHDPTCLLVCPRNLQQLKLYDNYQKQQLIRTNPKVIEL